MGKLKNFATLFIIQLVYCGIVTANWRAIALKNTGAAITTEFIWALVNFFLIRKIARDATDYTSLAGYVGGSMLGMWLILKFFP